jgi:hypothetical protein
MDPALIAVHGSSVDPATGTVHGQLVHGSSYKCCPWLIDGRSTTFVRLVRIVCLFVGGACVMHDCLGGVCLNEGRVVSPLFGRCAMQLFCAHYFPGSFDLIMAYIVTEGEGVAVLEARVVTSASSCPFPEGVSCLSMNE